MKINFFAMRLKFFLIGLVVVFFIVGISKKLIRYFLLVLLFCIFCLSSSSYALNCPAGLVDSWDNQRECWHADISSWSYQCSNCGFYEKLCHEACALHRYNDTTNCEGPYGDGTYYNGCAVWGHFEFRIYGSSCYVCDAQPFCWGVARTCVNRPPLGGCDEGCSSGSIPVVNGDACSCKVRNYDCSLINCPAGKICNPETGACDDIFCDARLCRFFYNTELGAGCYTPEGYIYDELNHTCKSPRVWKDPLESSGIRDLENSARETYYRERGKGGYEKRD